MNTMNGPEMQSLRDAMCSAFDAHTHDHMLMFRLTKSRERLVGDGALDHIVFELIKKADLEGWVHDLIQGAYESLPNAPSLRDFVRNHPKFTPRTGRPIGEEYNEILPERQSALNGKWTGALIQPIGPEGAPHVMAATITLKASRQLITGSGEIKFDVPDGHHIQTFQLEGGFLYGRLLQLQYRNKDRDVLQFGSMILELDDLSTKLQGTYAGYGVFSHRPVCGHVKVSKLPAQARFVGV